MIHGDLKGVSDCSDLVFPYSPWSVKHSGRRDRSRTDHGLRPCHDQSRPTGCFHRAWSRCTMDRTRDLGRPGNIQQRSRCFLICRGHDRGPPHKTRSALPNNELTSIHTKVFTGAAPFSDKSSHTALSAIMSGKRPPRPSSPTLTKKLWALIQQCWDQDPRLRPDAPRIPCGL